MRYISRTTFYTRPGERDQALVVVKRMGHFVEDIALAMRVSSALLSSDSAPDITAEFEFEADRVGEYIEREIMIYSMEEFRKVNAELVKHLSRAAKTELYLLEE